MDKKKKKKDSSSSGALGCGRYERQKSQKVGDGQESGRKRSSRGGEPFWEDGKNSKSMSKGVKVG